MEQRTQDELNELVRSIENSLERAKCLAGLHHRSEHEISAPPYESKQSFALKLHWGELRAKYQNYLKTNFRQKTIYDRLLYGERYYDILNTLDATPLLGLSDDRRKHAMKALATLAKFSGRYDQWVSIVKRHGLKWANPNASMHAFELITSDSSNVDNMIAWLKGALAKLPKPYGDVLRFNVLTGLRPSEAVLVYNTFQELTIKDGLLLLYKRPDLFIRRTKKAYVCVVTPEIEALGRGLRGNLSYQAVRIKHGAPFHAEYCRQIFATVLRQAGIESEIIDLLQGRLPQSVFLRHYYRPNFKKELERVREALTVSDLCSL